VVTSYHHLYAFFLVSVIIDGPYSITHLLVDKYPNPFVLSFISAGLGLKTSNNHTLVLKLISNVNVSVSRINSDCRQNNRVVRITKEIIYKANRIFKRMDPI
jgi:hypothetical protein